MRSTTLILILSLGAFLTSCASAPSPLRGVLWTGVSAPHPAGFPHDPGTADLQGRATAYSLFGLIAYGDASTQAACAAGGIRRLHHVDYRSTSFLGLFATYTTIAYGE